MALSHSPVLHRNRFPPIVHDVPRVGGNRLWLSCGLLTIQLDPYIFLAQIYIKLLESGPFRARLLLDNLSQILKPFATDDITC